MRNALSERLLRLHFAADKDGQEEGLEYPVFVSSLPIFCETCPRAAGNRFVPRGAFSIFCFKFSARVADPFRLAPVLGSESHPAL